eukprot:171681-Rhodomonas_salina.1
MSGTDSATTEAVKSCTGLAMSAEASTGSGFCGTVEAEASTEFGDGGTGATPRVVGAIKKGLRAAEDEE